MIPLPHRRRKRVSRSCAGNIPSNELFGEQRLLSSLNEANGLSVEEICKKVKADVDTFAGEADQFDDITMVSIKLNRFGTDTGGLQNG